MEFFGSRVGLLMDQFTQAFEVHLHHTPTAHGQGGLASLPAEALFDPPRPGRTDMKNLGDLVGGHRPVVSGQNPIPKILRVRSAHPWLLALRRTIAVCKTLHLRQYWRNRTIAKQALRLKWECSSKNEKGTADYSVGAFPDL